MSKNLTGMGRFLAFMILFSVACAKNDGPPATPSTANPPQVLKPQETQDSGGNSSGGGDAYAAEFKKIGSDLVGRMIWKNLDTVSGVDVHKLQDDVNSTDVKSIDAAISHEDYKDFSGSPIIHPLCLGQTEPVMKTNVEDVHRVDAINCPDQHRIILSLVNWKTNLNLFQKQRLVLHEYLGIMKIDDHGYLKSYDILRNLNLATTVKDSTITGPLASFLVSSIKWKNSEVSEVSADGGADGSRHFIAKGKIYTLKNDDGNILYCESGGVSIDQPAGASNVSIPLASCTFYDTIEIKNGLQFEVDFDQNHKLLWDRLNPNADQNQSNFNLGPVWGQRSDSNYEIIFDLSQ